MSCFALTNSTVSATASSKRCSFFSREFHFSKSAPRITTFTAEAINFNSIVRWDAQKRRIVAQLSGPFEHSAKFRWDLGTDLRNENWALRNGFTGPAPILAGFNMRHEAATFDLASHVQ